MLTHFQASNKESTFNRPSFSKSILSLLQQSTCHGCSYLGLICGYLQTCRSLITAAWNESQNGSFMTLDTENDSLCCLFFCGASLAMIKFITLTHIVQCFLWESQLLEQGLQNILFKPNCCSVLDTTVIFLLRKIQKFRAVILLQALSHQDTGVFFKLRSCTGC